MPDYGPTPRIKRVGLTPRIRREKLDLKKTSQEVLEEAIIGKLIYLAGDVAGKQAARIAYNYGLRDLEKLKYVKNFAQDEARSDTLRLLGELRANRKDFPEVTIEAEMPKIEERKEMLNMGLRQLKQDWI